MIQLSSKERAFLKKLAHNLDPIVRIGKDGIDENVLKSIAEVVKKRELIKVKILQNSSIEFNREMGDEIAQKTNGTCPERDPVGSVVVSSQHIAVCLKYTGTPCFAYIDGYVQQ